MTQGTANGRSRPPFDERLADEFRRAQRYDQPLSLVLLGVEGAQAVPEGREAVLRQVQEALAKGLRATDVCLEQGPPRFVLLLPGTPLPGALTVAERLWKGVDALRLGPEGTQRLRAGVGVASYPHRSVLNAEVFWLSAVGALERAMTEPAGHRIRLGQETVG